MYAFKRESVGVRGRVVMGVRRRGEGEEVGGYVCVCVGGGVCVQEQRCVVRIAPFTVTIMCMQST